MISTMQCKNQKIIILWDPVANVSLILHDAANRLVLKGSSIIYQSLNLEIPLNVF